MGWNAMVWRHVSNDDFILGSCSNVAIRPVVRRGSPVELLTTQRESPPEDFVPDSPASDAPKEHTAYIPLQSTEPIFPAAHFLDRDILHLAQLEIPRVNVTISSTVADMVGSVVDIHSTSALFFETVHKWMPILSKKQFYLNLLNRLSHRRAELFLLALSMKLCSSRVKTADSELYRVVKQLYFVIESCGTLSMQVLQAGILIALYELGHAIYPATFLSVGACARYATALGIDKTASSRVYTKLSWIEEEECRRAWWSILVLDRFVLPNH